ncbi:hypothetical protein QF017_001060 [Pseudomonas laurylsulfatiphila]|uniref:hypothetical protein n=1 Tax=Pseudomonas laurylsulfatiphila TaxID=2011015 RepID=UPI003D244CEC
MSSLYNPADHYDVLDPEGIKTGELRAGRYFEGDWEVGKAEGGVFHYNGEPAGRLDGMVLGCFAPVPTTRFQLIRQS